MKHWLFIPALFWVSIVAAGPSVEVPLVLPEDLAKRWLQADPALQGADSAFDAAKAEAGQAAASPYEWNATYSRQQRDYGAGPKSNEWNAGLERTFRLPGKVRADQASAEAASTAAIARRSLARRSEVEALLGSWLDLLVARSVKALLAEQLQAAEQSVEAVGKRVRSGDAAVLEQRLASAELTGIQRQASEAAIAEASAWALLSSRYPVSGVETPALPEPVPVGQSANWWQERILSQSDRLAVIRAELARAEAGAERARADRIPDPTFGVFAGAEAYGEEKVVGLSVSMPIPGAQRSLELRKQLAGANQVRQDLDLVNRRLTGAARSLHAEAFGNYERWKLARSGAETLQDNARLAQRAYTLGEQDLQALLLARRQALVAAEAETKAQVDALRSYYGLLLNAKLLWPDWLNAPVEPLADLP
jgi:cobalt-zinc-cadmium efflux system outer membrane protein